ncbi:hypothetical protein [Bacillus subtilis]|uniref:hypothetical protein n=1 Tax=Bacillus subtilis TaxID=1423 RepID=UPI002DB760BB|nr:hypothetical protein [Bacillus subtilis]MEC0348265.1 hypothetical protein [Bacillus subtilis]
MSKIPPEKYYEACITYHLVNYFEFTLEKKIYPFSISQIEEKKEGYDFGYKMSEKSFFIQHKRPYKVIPKDTYHWKIEIEQLKTINRKANNINTYYALPSFGDSMGWYEALDNTFFVNSRSLEYQIKQINRGRNIKTTFISPEKILLDKFYRISCNIVGDLHSVAVSQKNINSKIGNITNYIKGLNEDVKSSTWLYILEED